MTWFSRARARPGGRHSNDRIGARRFRHRGGRSEHGRAARAYVQPARRAARRPLPPRARRHLFGGSSFLNMQFPPTAISTQSRLCLPRTFCCTLPAEFLSALPSEPVQRSAPCSMLSEGPPAILSRKWTRQLGQDAQGGGLGRWTVVLMAQRRRRGIVLPST